MTFDEFLHEACPPLDLAWRKYRRRAARHRLDARLKELGVDSYGAYLEILGKEATEAALLPDLMLVTVTRFFREQHAWRELRERAIPGIMAQPPDSGRVIRAWSAGCCGGEEPFSLALSWRHYLQPLHPEWSLEIVATDIDPASLERAGRAVYPSGSLREVPSEIRDAFFSRTDSLWRLNDEIRSTVRFDKKNLLTDAPPHDIDLVLCRYLPFTYYRGERLMAAVRKLWESLRPGGFLMIGAKETVPASARELFEPLQESRIFYRRIE